MIKNASLRRPAIAIVLIIGENLCALRLFNQITETLGSFFSFFVLSKWRGYLPCNIMKIYAHVKRLL